MSARLAFPSMSSSSPRSQWKRIAPSLHAVACSLHAPDANLESTAAEALMEVSSAEANVGSLARYASRAGMSPCSAVAAAKFASASVGPSQKACA